MDALRLTRRVLATAGAVFTLLGGATARAEETGTRAQEARARVGLGAGGTSLLPMSNNGPYRSVVAAGAWAAIPLGTRLQLTPSITLYQLYAYGTSGMKTDLSVSLEYVFTWPRFRVVPGALLSLTQAGVVIGGPRGLGAGASLALQVPVTGTLELFARSEHRLVAASEEVNLVNQIIVGPSLGF